MEELLNFEIKIHLVEELENSIIKAASSDSGFLYYYIDSQYGLDYFDRFLEGPLLNDFNKYIYLRTKPLNDNAIHSWLTISLNQFSTHRPELRKEYLKGILKKDVYPMLLDVVNSNLVEDSFQNYFATIFKSYEQNFHLFQSMTTQAMEDFKKGYLSSFSKLSNQNFLEPKMKLKTKLSVPELAYFFKALKLEHIIDAKHDIDIQQFIIDNFSSKNQEEIGAKSIKNHFENPMASVIDYWQEKFYQLGHKAKKDKQK